jgi:tetraprenyl-beta-curcumene synthase
LALVDATDPDRPMTDYYAFHPWYDDGGYLAALVLAFRDACRSLPSYANVRAVLVHEARRARVLGLNHEPNPRRRDAALRTWAQDEFHDEFDRHGLSWFELTAAASTSLRVHALLSLATRPRVSDDMVAGTFAAHWPWVSLAATMLDSYVDQHEDRARGNHSYVAHYRDHDTAVARIAESVLRALQGALSAPDGYRHAVIVGCMVALYLSKDSARSPELRASTDVLAASGGSLVRLLLPILRAWRLLNHQRAS